MVVVMRPDASPEDVDAIVARVEAAGGSAFVSRGVQRTIVGLVGDIAAFTSLNLRAMNGVSDVVRVRWDPLESTCRHASLSIL